MDQDNLRMKFSALNVDFSSLSADPLGARGPAHESVKSGYFTDMPGLAWKQLQIGRVGQKTDTTFLHANNSIKY